MPARSCRCFARPGSGLVETGVPLHGELAGEAARRRDLFDDEDHARIAGKHEGECRAPSTLRPGGRDPGPRRTEKRDLRAFGLALIRRAGAPGRGAADEEERPVELPRIEPTVAAAEPTEEATVGAEGAELLLPAVGAATAGAGTFGLVGTGTGRRSRHRHLGHGNGDVGTGTGMVGTGTGAVGTGTETVGTGTGAVSARACPAARPAPSKTAAAATDRIPG